MSNEQKAILLRQIGHPLELGTRPVPVPGKNEVRVTVKATMILPHDAYCRDWGLFVGDNLPFVVGNNIAGVVEEVGSDVSTVKQGDRVFGITYMGQPNAVDQAGLQQSSILTTKTLVKSPDNLTDDQVATLPINLVTSWVALFSKGGFNWPAPFSPEAQSFDYASQTLIVIAAGSNVGKFAVQLASLAGVGKIITIAGASNKDQLMQMGATHFFDRHTSQDDLVANIHAVTGKDGATAIYDCYNDDFSLTRALIPAEKPSQVRTLHPLAGEEPAKFQSTAPNADAKFLDNIMGNWAPHGDGFWKNLPAWLDEGKILPTSFRVIEGLDRVDEINAALDHYVSGQGGAQVIVHP